MVDAVKTPLKIAALLLFFSLLPACALALCGDSICEPGGSENSCTCPNDCGLCEGKVLGEKCKVYGCAVVNDLNACRQVLLSNCCGNGSCEAEENYGSCPGDCLPSNITVEIFSPAAGDIFFRGEAALIKARATAEGRSVPSADMSALGFFGSMKLYNDGLHDDNMGGDMFYANSYLVPADAQEGLYDFNVLGRFMGVDGNAHGVLNIRPYFSVHMPLKQAYMQGDEMVFSGTVLKRGMPVEIKMRLTLKNRGETIFEEAVSSDSKGAFGTSYHTSLLDAPGKWSLRLYGSDDLNNLVDVSREIDIERAKTASYLNIAQVNRLDASYVRETEMQVVVDISDSNSSPVSGASVTLLTPLDETVQFQEFREGQYSCSYRIPYNMPLGNAKFEINASKTDSGVSYGGAKRIFATVTAAPIAIEIVEPQGLHYRIGDTLPVELRLAYPSGGLVGAARGTMLLGKGEAALVQASQGVLKADYAVTDEEAGIRKIFFKVEDDFGNSGLAEATVEVSGATVLYTLQKNLPLVAGGVVLLLALLAIVAFIGGMALLTRKMKGRKAELLELERRLQKEYFETHKISKEEYESLLAKYEDEMHSLERKLKEGDKQ
ncbi:MAG: hypothetical protein V1676_07365 [Candidatus Diapherotrites archaeon]